MTFLMKCATMNVWGLKMRPLVWLVHDEGGDSVEGFQYNNGIVRIDQCGATLYTICFSPAVCNMSPTSGYYLALKDGCAKAVQCSHQAMVFDFQNLSSGILLVLYNPQIQTADYNIEDALKSIATIITNMIY